MVDAIHPSTLGSCFVSEESSFCTTGTERRCFPMSDTLDYEATQAELDVKNLRPRPFDALDPVKGNKDGTVKLGYYLQPPPTVLTSGATVDGDAACPLAVFARCIFGGQSVFAGTTVAAGSGAVGGFTTATGHGSRFPAGQLCLVTDPDSSAGLVPARILTRSGDDVTFYPHVSGALADASPVVNLWTFYPTRTNGRSLSVAIAAAQASAHQWRFNGCTGSAEIKCEVGGLAQIMFDLKAANWEGPSDLSLSTADASDPMAAPLACRNAVLYLQAQGTTTRTNYKVDSFSAKLNFGNKHLTTLTGGTEGKRSVARVEGLTDTFAEIDVTFALDTTPDATWWAQRTKLAAMLWVLVDDANGARRTVLVDVAKGIVVGKPKHAKGADGLIKTTIKIRARLDDTTTPGTELAEAPFRLATG
ncbi:MAG: hypothetical protein IPQ07_38070 [Myxococcales bacterium]|nr:hypothetical protein [Myxococcales bacterium]